MAVDVVQSEATEGGLRPMDGPSWSVAAARSRAWGFRQSLAYSELLAERRGATCEFLEVHGAGGVLSSASVRVKATPIPGIGLAYISGGPVLACDPDGDQADRSLRDSLMALRAEYVRRRRLTLRIAPTVGPTSRTDRVNAVFQSLGFVLSPSAPRYRTILVDIARDEEAMRATMAQKWRNQLNGALRQETSVVFSREPDAVERFAPLYDETSHRKGFAAELGPEFYHRVQQAAVAHDRLVVAIACNDGADVAGAVLDVRGETATYILGATTEAGMKCKAAYALHWRAMLLAREAGCRWYDLGGVDPEGNPGVHHFKSGFGGVEATAPGPFELRPSGFAGMVSEASEGIYRRARAWRERALHRPPRAEKSQ